MSALQVYNSLLPLTKEDSLMSIHYAKYAWTGCRVEYIGRKQRNDCIKTIQVVRNWQHVPISSFSPDSTRILSSSERICIWEATSGKLIASPLAGDDEPDAFSATYSPPGGYIVAANEDGIPKKWDTLTHRLV